MLTTLITVLRLSDLVEACLIFSYVYGFFGLLEKIDNHISYIYVDASHVSDT